MNRFLVYCYIIKCHPIILNLKGGKSIEISENFFKRAKCINLGILLNESSMQFKKNLAGCLVIYNNEPKWDCNCLSIQFF